MSDVGGEQHVCVCGAAAREQFWGESEPQREDISASVDRGTARECDVHVGGDGAAGERDEYDEQCEWGGVDDESFRGRGGEAEGGETGYSSAEREDFAAESEGRGERVCGGEWERGGGRERVGDDHQDWRAGDVEGVGACGSECEVVRLGGVGVCVVGTVCGM